MLIKRTIIKQNDTLSTSNENWCWEKFRRFPLHPKTIFFIAVSVLILKQWKINGKWIQGRVTTSKETQSIVLYLFDHKNTFRFLIHCMQNEMERNVGFLFVVSLPHLYWMMNIFFEDGFILSWSFGGENWVFGQNGSQGLTGCYVTL